MFCHPTLPCCLAMWQCLEGILPELCTQTDSLGGNDSAGKVLARNVHYCRNIWVCCLCRFLPQSSQCISLPTNSVEIKLLFDFLTPNKYKILLSHVLCRRAFNSLWMASDWVLPMWFWNRLLEIIARYRNY